MSTSALTLPCVAFSGASGTGKTTLARWVSDGRGLPLNPVGARVVAVEMGFATPYDADGAGRRAEFQRRLIDRKLAWEAAEPSFVTDRTVADNLAYLILHDVHAVTEDLISKVLAGLARYTCVFYCPVAAFRQHGGDPARVPDPAYHWAFEAVLRGLLDRAGVRYVELSDGDLERRRADVVRYVELSDGDLASVAPSRLPHPFTDPDVVEFLKDHPLAVSRLSGELYGMMRNAATTRDDPKMVAWYAPVERARSELDKLAAWLAVTSPDALAGRCIRGGKR